MNAFDRLRRYLANVAPGALSTPDAAEVEDLLHAEIAALIGERREDARVKWRGAHRVRVITGDLIPATNQQTTSSRRKRFAMELDQLGLTLNRRLGPDIASASMSKP